MLLPFVAIGLRLTQGFLTGRGDEVLAVAQFDTPLLEQVIARLGEHDVLGLLLDGARHIDRVLGRGQTACGADFAVNAGHQAGIHGHDAFARQRGTTASIEFGSILHDTNGRADGIFGRSALFQQRIAGFKGPVQILLHLGATFRRVLLAAIASACVDHQKDSIRISWATRTVDCGNAASFVDIFSPSDISLMFDIRRYLTPVAATKRPTCAKAMPSRRYAIKNISKRDCVLSYVSYFCKSQSRISWCSSVGSASMCQAHRSPDKITFLSKATLVNRKHKSLWPLRIHVYRNG